MCDKALKVFYVILKTGKQWRMISTGKPWSYIRYTGGICGTFMPAMRCPFFPVIAKGSFEFVLQIKCLLPYFSTDTLFLLYHKHIQESIFRSRLKAFICKINNIIVNICNYA